MMAVVMVRRHTARAHAAGGEGLNLYLCMVSNCNGGAGWVTP